MRDKIYQSLYSKIQTSEEMDQRILLNLRQDLKQEKERNRQKFVFRFAVIILFCFVIIQEKPIYAAVENIVKHFVNSFELHSDDLDGTVVDMEGDYLKLNPDAEKEWCKMDSIARISKMLGVDILESSEEYKASNSISYYPYVSQKDVLNGVMLINHSYAMGDLKNVQLKTYSDVTTKSILKCDSGEMYKTPIGMQITIRSDQKEGVDYDNHELEYEGLYLKLEERGDVSDIKLKEIPNLEIFAVLYTLNSSGPFDTLMENTDEIESITVAMFLYEGIEYMYLGAVSQETMMEFLNTLR